MKKKLIFLLLMSFGYFAQADSPGRVYPYELLSENKNICLKSVPYSHYGGFGISYVLNTTTKDTLYTIDQYFSQPSLIDNSGKYIASIYSWPGQYPLKEIKAITFYKNGKEFNSVQLSELVEDSTKLFYSVSHISWLNKSSISGKKLILNVRGTVYEYDIRKGKKINQINDETEISEITFSELNIKYNRSIKYPNRAKIPKLKNGKELSFAFNSTHSFRFYFEDQEERKNINSDHFYAFILIDENGKGKLMNLDFEEKGTQKSLILKDRNQLEEIGKFVNSCEFVTENIPSAIGKWTFSTYFYVEIIE